MPTILITGAAGFIGSNFTRYWLEQHRGNWDIIAYDALTYAGNLANLEPCFEHPCRDSVRFVRGDICVADQLAPVMRGVDVVVNFAAESHVDRSIESAQDFIRTNVDGVRCLLDVARQVGIRRFLQVSTDEVYGSLGPTGCFTEDSPLQPNSPYSASKAAADLLVLAYHRTFGVPALVTRCSNNYGPYQFPEKLIPLFVTNLLEGRKVPVYGDGLQVRDWIHVHDHCRGLHAALERGRCGAVYNLGAGHECTNLQITQLILDHLGRDASAIEHVADRPGHDRRYALATDQAAAELQWRATVPFEQGLRQTIDWYVDHADWWRQIKTGAYLEYYQRQYAQRSLERAG